MTPTVTMVLHYSSHEITGRDAYKQSNRQTDDWWQYYADTDINMEKTIPYGYLITNLGFASIWKVTGTHFALFLISEQYTNKFTWDS